MSKKTIQQTIAENILVFRDHSWASNEYGADNLVALGTRAITPLLEALSDPDALVQAGVAQTLSQLGDQKVAPELEKAAQNRQIASVLLSPHLSTYSTPLADRQS